MSTKGKVTFFACSIVLNRILSILRSLPRFPGEKKVHISFDEFDRTYNLRNFWNRSISQVKRSHEEDKDRSYKLIILVWANRRTPLKRMQVGKNTFVGVRYAPRNMKPIREICEWLISTTRYIGTKQDEKFNERPLSSHILMIRVSDSSK